MSEQQQVGSAVIAAGSALLGVSIPVGKPVVSMLGVVVILAGVAIVLRDVLRGRRENDADEAERDLREDPEFWRAVFEAAPPMFVKECVPDEDGRLRVRSDKHFVENSATRLFQKPGVTSAVDSAGREAIRSDHRKGDEIALESETCCQLESCDTFGIQAEKQIVTFKRRVQVRDQSFIVGWYVPVDLPAKTPDGETLLARELKHQVVFGLVAPKAGYDRAHLRVGESARKAIAKRARRQRAA